MGGDVGVGTLPAQGIRYIAAMMLDDASRSHTACRRMSAGNNSLRIGRRGDR